MPEGTLPFPPLVLHRHFSGGLHRQKVLEYEGFFLEGLADRESQSGHGQCGQCPGDLPNQVLPYQGSHGSQVCGSGKTSRRNQRWGEDRERVRTRDQRWVSQPMNGRRRSSNRSSTEGNRRRRTSQVNQISYHSVGRRRRLGKMSKEILVKGCHAQNQKYKR